MAATDERRGAQLPSRLRDIRLRELSFAGWALALFAMGLSVFLCIDIGAWALKEIDRVVFRSWSRLICIALSLPALALAVLVFQLGRYLLRRGGVEVLRSKDPR